MSVRFGLAFFGLLALAGCGERTRAPEVASADLPDVNGGEHLPERRVEIDGVKALRIGDGAESRYVVLTVNAGPEALLVQGRSLAEGMQLYRPDFYFQLRAAADLAWMDEPADAGVYQAGPDTQVLQAGQEGAFLAMIDTEALASLETNGQIRICVSTQDRIYLCSPAYPATAAPTESGP